MMLSSAPPSSFSLFPPSPPSMSPSSSPPLTPTQSHQNSHPYDLPHLDLDLSPVSVRGVFDLDPSATAFSPARKPPVTCNHAFRSPRDPISPDGEVKLYVGNLEYCAHEARLIEVFGVFGEVTKVSIPLEKRKRPGKNRSARGFAFITFANRESAEMAISKMDGALLDGRVICVNESKPHNEAKSLDDSKPCFNVKNHTHVKLHVGNISFRTSPLAVRQLFQRFGEVFDCFLPVCVSGKKRGFALVTMAAADAELAFKHVNGFMLDGRVLKVEEAQPLPDVKLHVGNLPHGTTKEEVLGLFKRYGTVIDCKIPLDRRTGCPRGFAHVTMPSSEWLAACTCVNGVVFGGRVLCVKKWRAVDKSRIRKVPYQ